MKNSGHQIIRLWNLLSSELCKLDLDGNVLGLPIMLTGDELVPYQEAIVAMIEQKRRPRESQRGLAIYLDKEAIGGKVYSIHPSVEVYADQLWGVTEVQLYSKLTETEQQELTEELISQFFDGWGQMLEEQPIQTPDGEIYLHFWTSDDECFIKEESEMLRILSEESAMSLV